MTGYPKTITQVNKVYRELGIPVIAVPGSGYYYFRTLDGDPIADASVFSYRASDSSFDSWIDNGRRAAQLAEEEYGGRSKTEVPAKLKFLIRKVDQ